MTPQSDQQAVIPTQAGESLEALRYKEELAAKMGLPSTYQMNLMKAVCSDLVQSGFAPKHWGNNPAAMFMAALRGREMGLSPIESILEVFWLAPGGRLGMYATKMLQLMHKGGVKTEFTKQTMDECECVFTPPGNHPPVTINFHIDEARKAGLIKPDSNWVKWPKDMSQARVVTRGWRALIGLFEGGTANIYSKEELEDMEPSTTSEPSTDDQRRTSKLGDYVVKPKAAPPIDAAPSPAPSPVPTPETTAAVTPAPSPVEPPPDSKAKTSFAFYYVGDDGNLHSCPDEAPKDSLAFAKTVADRMTQETGQAHVVIVMISGQPGDEVYRTEAPKAEAPKAAETPAHDSEKPTEKVTRAPSTDPAKAKIQERVARIAKAMKLPERTALSRITSYLGGYLGVQAREVGKVPPERLNDPIEALEAIVGMDEGALRTDAVAVGTQECARNSQIGEACDKMHWPEPLRSMVMRHARRRSMDKDDLRAVVEANRLHKMAIQDVTAYYRVVLVHPDSAGRMLSCARDNNLSMAIMLDDIEKRGLKSTAEAADPALLFKSVLGYVEAVKVKIKADGEKLEPESGPEPRPIPDTADEDAEWLFNA